MSENYSNVESLAKEIQNRENEVVSNLETDARLRIWCGIIYEEILRPDWVKIWSEAYVICSVSPLHDRDIFDSDKDDFWGSHKQGDLKKPHRHVVFRFSGSKSFRQVWDILQMVTLPLEERPNITAKQIEKFKARTYTCPPPELPKGDIRAAVRYHIHKDHPDKAQYLKSDIISINGFDIEPYFRLNAEQEQIVFECLMDYITDNNITEYWDLLCCLRFSRFKASIYDELFNYSRTHTIVVKEMVRSRRFMGAEKIQLRHQSEIKERWSNVETESKETKTFRELMDGLDDVGGDKK